MQLNAMHKEIIKLLRAEKYGLAGQLIKQLMQTGPNEPFVWTAQAKLQYGKKKYVAAKQSIARALQLNNAFGWAHSMFGCIEAKLKNHTEAIEAFEVALKLEPENTEMLYDYAEYLIETRIDLTKAHRLVTRRMILLPENAANYELLGRVLLADKELQEAEQSFKTAIKFDPSDEKAYVGLAQIELFHKKNAFTASEWIRAALLIHPDSIKLREYFNQAQRDKNEIFGMLWTSGVFYGSSIKWSVFLAVSLLVVVPFVIFLRERAPQMEAFVNMLFIMFIIYCMYAWSSRLLMRLLLERRWLN